MPLLHSPRPSHSPRPGHSPRLAYDCLALVYGQLPGTLVVLFHG